MMQLQRARVPNPYALAQAVFRAASLSTGIAALVILVRLSVKLGGHKTYGVSIASVVVALVVDFSELAALLDFTRTIRRVEIACVIVGDIGSFGLGVGGLLSFLFGNYNFTEHPHNQHPNRPHLHRWRVWRSVTLWVLVAVAAWHLIFSIWGCLDCCLVMKRAPKVSERRHRPVLPGG